MSVEEFNKLDDEERMMYGQFVYDVFAPQVKPLLEKNHPKDSGEDYVEVAPDATLNDSGQVIIDRFVTAEAISRYMLTVNGDRSRLSDINLGDAQKMQILIYNPEHTSPYFEAQEELATLEDIQSNDGYDRRTAWAENEPYTAANGLRNKDIHVMEDNGEIRQYTAFFFEYEDIQGKERAQWIVRWVVGEGSPAWIPEDQLK